MLMMSLCLLKISLKKMIYEKSIIFTLTVSLQGKILKIQNLEKSQLL